MSYEKYINDYDYIKYIPSNIVWVDLILRWILIIFWNEKEVEYYITCTYICIFVGMLKYKGRVRKLWSSHICIVVKHNHSGPY